MCELFGLLLVFMLPLALLAIMANAFNRSQARKKARLIISGKKKSKVRTINKIIDEIRLSLDRKERKDMSESDRHLIEQLRRIRDNL